MMFKDKIYVIGPPGHEDTAMVLCELSYDMDVEHECLTLDRLSEEDKIKIQKDMDDYNVSKYPIVYDKDGTFVKDIGGYIRFLKLSNIPDKFINLSDFSKEELEYNTFRDGIYDDFPEKVVVNECTFIDCLITCNMEYETYRKCVFIGCRFVAPRVRLNTCSFFIGCNFYVEDLTIDRALLLDCNIPENVNVNKTRLNCGSFGTTNLCPSEGSFIAWKKIMRSDMSGCYIAKLLIPEDAKRSSATTLKCRADKVEVLDIQTIGGMSVDMEGLSIYDSRTTYKKGEVVYADGWDDNRWSECSHGIHFFIDRENAVHF